MVGGIRISLSEVKFLDL
eukprot:Gb_19664 [translate_table: standard]